MTSLGLTLSMTLLSLFAVSIQSAAIREGNSETAALGESLGDVRYMPLKQNSFPVYYNYYPVETFAPQQSASFLGEAAGAYPVGQKRALMRLGKRALMRLGKRADVDEQLALVDKRARLRLG